jgi:ABC-2 type transport system ATP-binding protein
VTHAIQTNKLRYRAGRSFELTGVDLRVPRGAVYGFLGPNGAGKTTMVRLLLGMLRADSGTIDVLGEPMPAAHASVLGRVGYVPERPHLYPSLTVGEAVAFHRAFYKSWDAAFADDLLGQFGLDDSQRIGSMSKGETGKLLMLLALSQRPELLVLDEPTDGLDPVVRRDILSALAEFVTDRNATVFISSHLVHELERICDWIGLLDRGRLLAELPMQEFKNGIKRLRVEIAASPLAATPFTLLSRERNNGSVEQWTVQGWTDGMTDYVTSVGGTVREVIDLDLEDGFVELLRSSRTTSP